MLELLDQVNRCRMPLSSILIRPPEQKFWIFTLFKKLNEVREITENWLTEYNNELPNKSLNNLM